MHKKSKQVFTNTSLSKKQRIKNRLLTVCMESSMMEADISAADWYKGIGLSVLASVVGGASKLAIRKSWLMEATSDENSDGSVTEPLTGGCCTTCRQTSSSMCLDCPCAHPAHPCDEDQTADTDNDDELEAQRKRCITYFLRCSGMFGMSVLNPICCVLAMNYASPSILAPFSGLTLVWVILFSYPVVGEQPSTTQIVAACFIIIGEVIVAIFGDHTNDDAVTVEDVRHSYLEPAFLSYFGAIMVYVLLAYYWIMYAKSPVLRRFAWGTSGGVMTGLQNFLKDTLTIYKAVQQQPAGQQEYPWFFFFFLAMAAASAFWGLLILTACMKRYDATYSAAMFVGSFVVSASIMSAVHYDTFAGLTDMLNYILYPAGLLILMVGVVILANTKEQTEEDEDVIVEPVRKNTDDSQKPFHYLQVEQQDVKSEESAPDCVV